MTAAAAESSRTELQAQLGVEGVDPELLERALTHRSYAYENGGLATNERLEFLGDSVLGVVVTEALYLTHPDLSEGRLAKLRAAVVNVRALAEVARTLGLGEHIRLGRGEEATGGRDKSSILSDTVEALIGAVYLDTGFVCAGQVVHRLFDPLMAAAADLGAGLDWKTSLQELGGRPEPRGAGIPDRGQWPGPREDLRRRVRVGARSTARAPAGQEGGRAAGRRDRLACDPGGAASSQGDGQAGAHLAGSAAVRRRRPAVGLAATVARRWTAGQIPVPELPEVEVVRRGLDAW